MRVARARVRGRGGMGRAGFIRKWREVGGEKVEGNVGYVVGREEERRGEERRGRRGEVLIMATTSTRTTWIESICSLLTLNHVFQNIIIIIIIIILIITYMPVTSSLFVTHFFILLFPF